MMFGFATLDLVRQQQRRLERRAEHARLVREARPPRKRSGAQGR